MDAQRFLAEFGHVAGAPGGVQQLRELILQLAICGKLVELSAVVQPVADSIVFSSQLRLEYEAELGLRATRVHPPITVAPFIIPEHWQWVRLEQLALYIQRGKSPKYADHSTIHVVSQKCVQWSGFSLTSARFIADDSLNTYGIERFLKEGDLLWNSTGTGTAGRVAIYDQLEGIKAVADSHVTVIRLANCLPKYIWCVIASPWIQSRIEPTHTNSLVSGTTQQVELSTSTVKALPIPCPPIDEQARIVAKVDELMTLCDKLEAQQQEREELRKRCCTEIIKSLALYSNTHELRKAWNSTQVFLSYPFKNKEEISSLRTAIMKLATRGILTSQYTHESGLDFINELAELRTKKSTNRSRKFNEDPVEEREIPHLIPENWVWIRLGAVAEISSGSTPLKSRDDYHISGTIPWVTSTLTGRLFVDSAEFFITEKAVKECNLSIYPAGTLIMAMYGQGKTRGQVTELHIAATTNQACAAIVLLDKSETFRRYVRIVLEERYHDIREFADGGPQPNLNGIKVKATVIPIPPKEEQERIVAIVSVLTRLCDDLESKLHDSTTLAKKLATAAISSITGIRTEEEKTLKTPKTELISKLRLANNPDIKEQAPLAAILARHQSEMSAGDLWQRYGGEIDAFYAQLKQEVGKGWIAEPAIAQMRETEAG